MLSRQETGRLLVRTVAITDPGDLLARLPQPDVVALGTSRGRTSPAGARRSGSRSRRGTTGSPPRRSGFARCSTPSTSTTGSGARLGPGRVRHLYLRRLVRRLRPHPPAHGARAGRPRPRLAHHGYRTGRDPRDWPAARESRAGRADRNPLADGSLPGPRWQQAVADAVAAIKAGGLRKVVLARDVFATADEPIERAGPAAAAGRPLSGLLHVRLRRHARRHPRAADQAGRSPGQRAGARRHAAARGRPGAGQGPRRGTARLGEEQRGARLCGRVDSRRARDAV